MFLLDEGMLIDMYSDLLIPLKLFPRNIVSSDPFSRGVERLVGLPFFANGFEFDRF